MKTYAVYTTNSTYCKNVIDIDETTFAEYKAHNPELSDTEIALQCYCDGSCHYVDTDIVDFLDEEIDECCEIEG